MLKPPPALGKAERAWLRDRIVERNRFCSPFFQEQALPLARAASEMALRFSEGGRLLAFGRGAYSTDAMHLSVEFIHPVLVGKRALPALDVSAAPHAFISAVAGPRDMAIALGPPQGDAALEDALVTASRRGAFTIAWPSASTALRADYGVAAPVNDVHVHQELFELMGHTMYESVHVFLEHLSHHERVSEVGFLYPFLSESADDPEGLIAEVASSILAKASDADELRRRVATEQLDALCDAIAAIRARLARGGRILTFGNGGSATDATDFVLDCVDPEVGWPAIPAISLALEPAVITATANDVGVDVIFLRQLIAQSRPNDIMLAFSTSGGSRNIVAALEEGRKRGLLAVALLGYDGGEIVRRNLADVAIVVPCDFIPRIQEAQATIYHVLREALARA